MIQRKLLSTRVAARLLFTTPRVVRLMIQRGLLPAVRLTDRGHWRIPHSAVLAMIELREKTIAEWVQLPDVGGTNMTPIGAVEELRRRLKNSGHQSWSKLGSAEISSVAGLFSLACLAYETQNDDLADIFAAAISQELKVSNFEMHTVGRVLSQVIVAGHSD